ncbi:MAG: hypothetical protein WKF78_12725 [Candidatus Limnocylindrales bacterium]
MAIDIHIVNAGPAIQGEVRLGGGVQGRTRFSVPADLPTTSDKTLRLYAQPPAFGKDVTVTLVEGETVIATTKAALVIHDPTQLVVGIVAERPGDIIGSLNLLPNQNNVAPLTLPLDPEDLPERVQAWGTLDRLVWQDTDSSRLSTNQLEAMRGWIAGGGRLVIVGGTAGPSSLSAFPGPDPAVPPDGDHGHRGQHARGPGRDGTGGHARPAGTDRDSRGRAGPRIGG